MIGIIHKVGMRARLGVATFSTGVEDIFVEIVIGVVEVAVRVVIRYIFL